MELLNASTLGGTLPFPSFPGLSETKINWKLKQESEASGRNPLQYNTIQYNNFIYTASYTLDGSFLFPTRLRRRYGFISYVVLDANHREKSSDCSRFTRNEAKQDALDYSVSHSCVSSICGPPWTGAVLSSNLLLWQKYETSSLQLCEWHFRCLQHSYDGGTSLCLHRSS